MNLGPEKANVITEDIDTVNNGMQYDKDHNISADGWIIAIPYFIEAIDLMMSAGYKDHTIKGTGKTFAEVESSVSSTTFSADDDNHLFSDDHRLSKHEIEYWRSMCKVACNEIIELI